MGIRRGAKSQHHRSGQCGVFWYWRYQPLPANGLPCRLSQMRAVLVGAILAYQHTAPVALRQRCIFSESCSNFVLRTTRELGVRKGIGAFALRLRRCRPGYFGLPPSPAYPDLSYPVRLADGSIVDLSELSSRVQAELSGLH